MQILVDSLEDRASRWALIAAFAARYLRPFTTSDSTSIQDINACGHLLPQSLIEFYSLCGNASDVWSGQDEWLNPVKLRHHHGVLIFWVENQGNWCIGVRETELALEDPPVVWNAADWTYGVGAPGQFTTLAESVSQFALNMVAYIAKFFELGIERSIGYTFDAEVLLATLCAAYHKCELQREWVCGPEWYFQDHDTFIEVNEGDGFVYPLFKTSAAISRFCSLVDRAPFQWEQAPAGS